MARLLVIDDDTTVRSMIAMTLGNAGHEVVEAPGGKEGAALFRASPTDVVITDIVLPDNGIHDVVELRREYPSVPFMVVSGMALHSAETVEVVRAMGVQRIVPKPFRLSDFLGATGEVISQSKTPWPTATVKSG